MGTQDGAAAATSADEGAAPAEGEETEVTPAEGDAPAGDAPADGDKEGEGKPKEEEVSEEVKAAAEKYAAATLGLANKTMAAARRAEKRAEEAARANEKTASDLRAHQAFVADLRKNPLGALGELGIGDGSARGFLSWLQEQGGGAREPQPADEIAELKRWRKEREEREANERQQAEQAASKARLKEAITKAGPKYARTSSRLGQEMLWDAIVGYHRAHGACPDDAVFRLADGVERELRAEFGEPSFAPATGEQGGTPPGTSAAPPGRNGGKNLTSRQMSGAPVSKELPLDPDERRRLVNEELRQQGLL